MHPSSPPAAVHFPPGTGANAVMVCRFDTAPKAPRLRSYVRSDLPQLLTAHTLDAATPARGIAAHARHPHKNVVHTGCVEQTIVLKCYTKCWALHRQCDAADYGARWPSVQTLVEHAVNTGALSADAMLNTVTVCMASAATHASRAALGENAIATTHWLCGQLQAKE